MTKESDIDLPIVEPAAENRHEESVAITGAMGDVRFLVGGISPSGLRTPNTVRE